MHARVVNVQFKPGQLDEAKRIIKESVVPVLKQQEGFKNQFVLIQQETRKAVSINLWDTEEDLAAFEQGPHYGDVLGKLAAVLAAPPDSEAYEVSIQA